MIIFPAIDLYRGKAVRLVAGDYERMTVYRDDPAGTAREFKDCGAECVHVVDLEGAKSGSPRNAETVLRNKPESGLCCPDREAYAVWRTSPLYRLRRRRVIPGRLPQG